MSVEFALFASSQGPLSMQVRLAGSKRKEKGYRSFQVDFLRNLCSNTSPVPIDERERVELVTRRCEDQDRKSTRRLSLSLSLSLSPSASALMLRRTAMSPRLDASCRSLNHLTRICGKALRPLPPDPDDLALIES